MFIRSVEGTSQPRPIWGKCGATDSLLGLLLPQEFLGSHIARRMVSNRLFSFQFWIYMSETLAYTFAYFYVTSVFLASGKSPDWPLLLE